MNTLAKIIENGAGAPKAVAQDGYPALHPGGSGGGFTGADFTSQRGMVYFPELDTRKEINPANRRELMRRARWMYANLGFVRRCINGVARMVVGNGMIPQPFTEDHEWNDLATTAFSRRTGQANVFDVSGKYNFAQSQRAMVRHRLKDGDMSSVMTESATGRARFGFYEGHQVGTSRYGLGMQSIDLDGWYDGVKVGRFNEAQRYRVLGDGDTFRDIAARDFIFHCDYERAGQRRGVTCLAHAVNNLLDATEIQSFLKQGVKVANQVGYYIADKGGPTKTTGIHGTIADRVRKVNVDGKEINVQDIYGEGGDIPDLPPGKELRLLSDTRPHPNTLGFLGFLLRDVAWGLGISVELLWDIASLGGANTRYILADAQSFIEEQQQLLVDQYCTRVWLYTIAKEIKAGSLRAPTDPDWFFKVGWIPPARVTVDFGRDGKLHLEQHRAGMLTFKRFYGWQNLPWRQEVEQWVDERAHIKKYAFERHGLTMDEVYGTLPTQPAEISENREPNNLPEEGT